MGPCLQCPTPSWSHQPWYILRSRHGNIDDDVEEIIESPELYDIEAASDDKEAPTNVDKPASAQRSRPSSNSTTVEPVTWFHFLPRNQLFCLCCFALICHAKAKVEIQNKLPTLFYALTALDCDDDAIIVPLAEFFLECLGIAVVQHTWCCPICCQGHVFADELQWWRGPGSQGLEHASAEWLGCHCRLNVKCPSVDECPVKRLSLTATCCIHVKTTKGSCTSAHGGTLRWLRKATCEGGGRWSDAGPIAVVRLWLTVRCNFFQGVPFKFQGSSKIKQASTCDLRPFHLRTIPWRRRAEADLTDQLHVGFYCILALDTLIALCNCRRRSCARCHDQ